MYCRQRTCAITKSFRCNTYEKEGGSNSADRQEFMRLLPVLRVNRWFSRLISRQRTIQRRHQPDRNQEATILLPHDLKPGKILPASAAHGSHRIAPRKFRDLRREVPRLKRNLRRCPAHSHRNGAMLARFQWRRVGSEFEPDKCDGKRWRLALRAGDFHNRAARMQVRGRKYDERCWRRRQHDRRLPRDRHLIGVSVSAEAAPKKFSPTRQGSHERRG